MSNNHSSTTARPDAWLASVMSGSRSLPRPVAYDNADLPLTVAGLNAATERLAEVDTAGLERSVDDICTLVDRLRERLEQERAIKGELLAACKGFVAMYEGLRDTIGPSVTARLLRADAAIAMAEGQS